MDIEEDSDSESKSDVENKLISILDAALEIRQKTFKKHKNRKLAIAVVNNAEVQVKIFLTQWFNYRQTNYTNRNRIIDSMVTDLTSKYYNIIDSRSDEMSQILKDFENLEIRKGNLKKYTRDFNRVIIEKKIQ